MNIRAELRDQTKLITTDIKIISSHYQTFRNEPVELISFVFLKPKNYQGRFIKSLNKAKDLEDNEEANFIHEVSTLNLFRHKYISECYDADITSLSIIIPRYEKDFIKGIQSIKSCKLGLLRLKAAKQIIKLALFLESLKLQDYEIKLEDLRYEKFDKTFRIKFFYFYHTFFQDLDGRLSKKSARSLSEALTLIFTVENSDNKNEIKVSEIFIKHDSDPINDINNNINETKELELLLIYDSVPIKAINNYLKEFKIEPFRLIHQISKILDDYSRDDEKGESLYLLRKVAKLVFSDIVEDTIKFLIVCMIIQKTRRKMNLFIYFKMLVKLFSHIVLDTNETKKIE